MGSMEDSYPEPPEPEALEPTPAVSLEQFMDLSGTEQEAIWSDLMSTTQATKADTSQIIELVTPKGSSEDPLLPLIQEMIEISMRSEQKIDEMSSKVQLLFTQERTLITDSDGTEEFQNLRERSQIE